MTWEEVDQQKTETVLLEIFHTLSIKKQGWEEIQQEHIMVQNQTPESWWYRRWSEQVSAVSAGMDNLQ